MRLRRNRFSLEHVDPQLEPRALLSRPDGLPAPAAVIDHQAGGRNLFHSNGINGLVLHRTFVNRLNDRLNNSKDQTTRAIQAFQVFTAGFQQLPVNPPPGSSGPTLASLVATLKQEVAVALTRREGLSTQASVSERTSIRFAPPAPVALVPFADAQIDTMAAALQQLPPAAGSGGALVPGNPAAAVNQAVNAIVNAVAETSIHPLLFNQPGDFYLNPHITFSLSFSGTPAASAPGYFIRGPHGTILPGATLHPYAPN
jgi:hypothetical protein